MPALVAARNSLIISVVISIEIFLLLHSTITWSQPRGQGLFPPLGLQAFPLRGLLEFRPRGLQAFPPQGLQAFRPRRLLEFRQHPSYPSSPVWLRQATPR